MSAVQHLGLEEAEGYVRDVLEQLGPQEATLLRRLLKGRRVAGPLMKGGGPTYFVRRGTTGRVGIVAADGDLWHWEVGPAAWAGVPGGTVLPYDAGEAATQELADNALCVALGLLGWLCIDAPEVP